MTKRLSVAVLFGLSAAAGCVDPGRIDPNVLNRYQQHLREASPQRRAGGTGLKSLRPMAEVAAEPLPAEPVVEREAGEDGRPRRVGGQSGREALLAEADKLIGLDLDEAVRRALANSAEIRVVSFDPAIAREDMVRAAAAFDAIVFADWSYEQTDEETATLGLPSQSDQRSLTAGLRQTTPTGGTWEAAWTMTRTWSNSAFQNVATTYEQQLSLEVAQPLLRNAWPAVNLAELRIARVNRRITEQQFRQKVEETLADVINTYWTLHQARAITGIQERLLAATEQTLRRVKARGDLDATAVQIKQAESAVASRRADLLRARKQVLDAQESLARLLSDPQLNLLDAYELVPTTPPTDEGLLVDVQERIVTALSHNPQLEQVRLGLQGADIEITVAKNQLLPKLDLTAGTHMQGLSGARHQSSENLWTGDYLSYRLALQFEYPLGNRQRRAELRQKRYQKLQQLTRLQNLSDQVALQVKERVRELQTRWTELQAQREAVEAARRQLQALNDIERIRGQLTPEFLDLKLTTQERLANAERAAAAALAAYNTSQTDLDRVTGTIWRRYGLQIVPSLLNETAGDGAAPAPQTTED